MVCTVWLYVSVWVYDDNADAVSSSRYFDSYANSIHVSRAKKLYSLDAFVKIACNASLYMDYGSEHSPISYSFWCWSLLSDAIRQRCQTWAGSGLAERIAFFSVTQAFGKGFFYVWICGIGATIFVDAYCIYLYHPLNNTTRGMGKFKNGLWFW